MPSNEVDHALSAAVGDVGRLLLAATEDQWFDRKGAQIAARDLGPALVAFANAEGGTIVIGLSKDQVQGLKALPKRLNEYRQAPMDFTVPPVRANFEEKSCINGRGEQDFLLVIRVDPSERVHETQNGDCYLRVGDESRKLNYQQRQELEYDKGQSQYDGLRCESVTFNHLNGDLMANYRRATGASGSIMDLFAARSLLTMQNDLTNAAYLLFGKHPQDKFPQAYVRVIRYLSTERGTGSRLGVEEGSDTRVEGPIPVVIQSASDLIDDLVPYRRSLAESGRFEARPIVPRDAWLEGLVNAVIHRSYSLAGDHIRVEIFPNRVEIESPGRFPGLAQLSRPLEISRFARNPRIARVCADLRIGQELGEGIRRIFEEMRRVGLTDPVYKQSGGSVRLVLASVPRLSANVAARLPRNSQRVLDAMRAADRPLGTGDLAAALGISRPAVSARLKALEREGLIRWVGKSPKDPRAVWVIAEE